MPSLNIIDSPTLFLLGSVLVLAVVVFLKNKTKGKEKQLDQTELQLENRLEQSYGLVHRAIKKSQEMLGLAELESIKVVADTRLKTEKFEKELEAQLSQNAHQTEEEVHKTLALGEQQISQAQAEFSKFLESLKAKGIETENASQELAKQKINQLFENFESRLADFLVQTEQRSITSIQLELNATRQLIETYKAQQLKVIDENIIAMLEKTLSLVLTKKLSLKDQVDLVYEALEKAKAEKFIT